MEPGAIPQLDEAYVRSVFGSDKRCFKTKKVDLFFSKPLNTALVLDLGTGLGFG